jgi:hypothetical protein
VRGEDAKQLVVEVARDKGKCTADGIGPEFELSVDVSKDEDEIFLYFFQVSGGEQLV